MAKARWRVFLPYPQICHPLGHSCNTKTKAWQECQGGDGRCSLPTAVTCQSDVDRDLSGRAILMVTSVAGGRRRSEIAGLRKKQLSPEEPVPVQGAPSLTRLSKHSRCTQTSGASNAWSSTQTGSPVKGLNARLHDARTDGGSVFRAIDRWGNASQRTPDPKAINDILERRVAMADRPACCQVAARPHNSIAPEQTPAVADWLTVIRSVNLVSQFSQLDGKCGVLRGRGFEPWRRCWRSAAPSPDRTPCVIESRFGNGR